jgi:flavodoxin
MKDNLILYASRGNSAKKVAEFLQENLNDNSQIICVNNNVIKAEDFNFSLLILVCPTYGDEELEADMENFLIKSNWNNHRGKYFTVCELGLYRGYLETCQGAGAIISNYLKSKGLLLHSNILSIDSIPLEDFSLIKKWSDALFE